MGKQTATPDRAMRADALRNREKLLAAATDLFASGGTDVSLEAVAEQAGVGIGTLYRHFPTREALVEAAYRSEVESLCGAAADLLGSNPPSVALERWMSRFVGYSAAKRGMVDALQSVVASNSDLFAETRRQIIGAIDLLVKAGVADGSLRPDADPEDVLHALGAIWLLKGPGWEKRAERLLSLLMDGLRYGT
ncbi:MAG: hypothetical protein QOG62_284 [Thermoleophilaceae bacterium]|jgi:AcrR family transcriptional regulator|nr:hypothetical protein [Thermoleophilaceae bacterium]